jgi:hypothetical protein
MIQFNLYNQDGTTTQISHNSNEFTLSIYILIKVLMFLGIYDIKVFDIDFLYLFSFSKVHENIKSQIKEFNDLGNKISSSQESHLELTYRNQELVYAAIYALIPLLLIGIYNILLIILYKFQIFTMFSSNHKIQIHYKLLNHESKTDIEYNVDAHRFENLIMSIFATMGIGLILSRVFEIKLHPIYLLLIFSIIFYFLLYLALDINQTTDANKNL